MLIYINYIIPPYSTISNLLLYLCYTDNSSNAPSITATNDPLPKTAHDTIQGRPFCFLFLAFDIIYDCLIYMTHYFLYIFN